MCQPLIGVEWPQSRIEEAKCMVSAVTNKVTKQFAMKYGLHCCGQGVAMCGGPIRSIGLTFQSNHLRTKMELRRLLIACANEIVNTVRETPGIEAYLHHPPFTLDDVSIAFFLRDSGWAELYAPEIGVASINKYSGLSFWYYTRGAEPGSDRHIIKET